MKLKCDCKDFKEEAPKIIAADIAAWNHGMPYEGKIAKFCPWCGKELKGEGE